jgi:methylated-DNA-protein-cysteine methyltransferase-like protein
VTRFERIYAVVRKIPRGKVATYGQIAALAGMPRHARYVGSALRSLPDDSEVPWHRVINAGGRVSCRSHGDHDDLQRVLLEQEGIAFGKNGRIPMLDHQWDD